MSKTHVVEPGECLSSIARKYGFVNWRIIWDAPDNADLKKKRPNPDVIYPGDEVAIPDNKPKEVSVGKGASVDTSLKPEKISLRLAVYIDPDDKGPKGRWELKVEGVEDPLKSDLPSDGTISVEIPAKANKAVLQLFLTGGNEPDETYKLALGHLDPASTVSGAQERLRRLGYECGEVDGILGVRTRSALLTFQEMNGLDATGKLDQPTANKLVDLFEGGGAYPTVEASDTDDADAGAGAGGSKADDAADGEVIFDEQIQLVDQVTGEPLGDCPYVILKGDDLVTRGETDDEGMTERVESGAAEAEMTILWGDEALAWS
jgi:hypothetical protein